MANSLNARNRYVRARNIMSGALNSGAFAFRSPTAVRVSQPIRMNFWRSGRRASIRISIGEKARRKAETGSATRRTFPRRSGILAMMVVDDQVVHSILQRLTPIKNRPGRCNVGVHHSDSGPTGVEFPNLA